ncbi:FAM160A1 family protein [Megaselia abdita]
MSWLRSSPLRQSLSRNTSQPRPGSDCDPKACYDSFCRHWHQSSEIINKSTEQNRSPTHDDVLGVVSHLDFMVTLLLVELHNANKIALPGSATSPPAPCLEFLLSENLLDKLYEWGNTTGRYSNAVRLEQLKLYELLVSHSKHQLLCHEPFLRPLLKILASSQGELFPPDVEKRLVILLNQLCVVLMQNVHLLDLFFFSANQQGGQHNNTNFIIFSLLIPYVHREGSLGHQARDALLLCMALSKKNANIGTYIAKYSSMCPLLVTGLGGLYSRLPSTLEINTIDWHRITPDDVTDIPELTLFMNSLEFCNAVVQVAHDLIKHQLLDFLYQGFIVPVLGPAILQTNIDSQISAMAYLDLILRSVSEPALLRAFVKFFLDTEKFDGCRILDSLVDRISSPDSNLCMVTLSLFDTIIGLNCEDIMLELLLKFLLPGKHISISCRHKINKIDPNIKSSEFFLELTPDVMKRASHVQLKHLQKSSDQPSSLDVSKTIGANWNHYGMFSGDTLYSNYHAYLFDAHHKIAQCKDACGKWSNDYRYQKTSQKQKHQNVDRIIELLKNFLYEFNTPHPGNTVISSESNDKYDSLQSIGESSGYESFKWRPDDEVDFNESFDSGKPKTISCNVEPSWRMSSLKDQGIGDMDFSDDLFAQGTVNLGSFLNALWGKLQTFTSNGLYVNLILTQVITRLAWYPITLVHSLLLRSDITITSDTPSFHQILKILKQQIDAELPPSEDSLEIIDVARTFLVDREFRLLNSRKNPVDSDNTSPIRRNTSANNPVQLTPASTYDPFKRNDSKRISLSKSISSIFGRRGSSSSNSNVNNASTGLSQIYAFFTGKYFFS